MDMTEPPPTPDTEPSADTNLTTKEQYCQLQWKKRKLLDCKATLDAQIRKLEPQLIVESQLDNNCSFTIDPTPEEAERFGGFGAIEVKEKKDFDRMTYANICKLNIRFYQMLFPAEDGESIGIGQSKWCWANRDFVTKATVERTYYKNGATQPGTKRARQEPREGGGEAPMTREDFTTMPIFKRLDHMHRE